MPHKLYFPAVIVGSLLIVFLVSLVANPQMVLAKSPSNSAEEVFSTGQGCSLGANISASVVQWCDLIEKYAREHGLEPQLIAAVMQIESQGDPQAYSQQRSRRAAAGHAKRWTVRQFYVRQRSLFCQPPHHSAVI